MNGVVGLNRRNIDLVMGKNRRKYFPLVDDKIKTKTILQREGYGAAPTIAECNSFFEIDMFQEKMIAHGGPFVLKPARGYGGEGIVIVKSVSKEGIWNCGSLGMWDANKQRTYIAEILYGVYSMGGNSDVAFTEEFIVAHEGIQKFAQDGLPDIRVIIHDGVPIAAMLRVPTSESEGKANLHAGGCATSVDIKNGTTGCGWYRGSAAEHHPEKGFAFAGNQIPHWEKVLEISRSLYEHFPLGYMGADFTIDEVVGPVILELNARPGLEIQNVLGEGLSQIIGAAE